MQDSLDSMRVLVRRIVRLEHLEERCIYTSERARIRLDRRRAELGLYSYTKYVSAGLHDWRVAVDGWSRKYGKAEPESRQLRLLLGGKTDRPKAA